MELTAESATKQFVEKFSKSGAEKVSAEKVSGTFFRRGGKE
jgi:hypothetical protein